MTFKTKKMYTRLALVLSLSAVFPAVAQDAQSGEKSDELDPRIKEEIAYVEALVYAGFPRFAETVIAETKKKWPESEALFFAIEIRNLLLLGKGEEVNKMIAALPDRKGSKYWAARLEVALDHNNRSRKEQSLKEFDDFFKNNANPPKELRELVRTAHWARAQIYMSMKRYHDAAKDCEAIMADLAKLKDKDEELANNWCSCACEAADLYLRVASEIPNVKDRKKDLDSAKKIISQLLWMRDRYVYFGRAIAMKAHLEFLSGRLDRSQGVIDDYMTDLADIHDQLEKSDPDGRYGLLKLSPMPQCRYLLADMLWKEAQKKSKGLTDLSKVKGELGDLLFGARGKNGKRNNAGAYNHAINVYIRYPYSPWASAAEKTVGEIEKFMEEKFEKKIATKITPAQRAKVREMRFKNAAEKFGAGEFEPAIADYFDALAAYPEEKESVAALSKIVDGYYELMKRTTDREKLNSYRMRVDVVSGYLAERFAGAENMAIMNEAGNAVLSIAAKEKRLNELARADALYMAFICNYTRHALAPTYAAQLGGVALQDAMKLEGDLAAAKYREAIKYFKVMEENYTASPFYASALSSLSTCYDKLGDKVQAIAYLKKYIEVEKKPILRMQAQMRLASIYQNEGLALLKEVSTEAKSLAVSTNAVAEDVAKAKEELAKKENVAVVKILSGIKTFENFAKEVEPKFNDPTLSQEEKEKFQDLHKKALFFMGYCWSRLIEPSKRMPVFAKKGIVPQANAIKCLEEFVAKYPKSGDLAKSAYRQLATIHTANDDIEKTKDALDRLCKYFPESDEARMAWPMLAKSLVEFAQTVPDEKRKTQILDESSRIYADMIRATKSNYKAHDYLLAGESLIEAKNWTLAEEAFDRVVDIASKTNNLTTLIARGTIGKIEVKNAKGDYAGALVEIDSFLENKRFASMQIGTNVCIMASQIAKKYGDPEGYKTANKALEQLARYWKSAPVWQNDYVKLMSADMNLAQADENERKGDKKSAYSMRGKVASSLYGLIDARKPRENRDANAESATPAKPAATSGEKTLEEFLPKELEVLEKAYGILIPALMKLENKQLEDVKTYGEQYLKYFPEGPNAVNIRRIMDDAAKESALKK